LELASRNPSWQAVSAPPSTGRTYDPKRSDPLAAPPLASRRLFARWRLGRDTRRHLPAILAAYAAAASSIGGNYW